MSAGAYFARPEALVLLALVPLVWAVLAWLDRRRTRKLEHLVGPRIHALAEERSEGRRAARRWLFSLALAFAVLAAAGPLYGHSDRDTEWQGVDLVVALDVSRSMLAEDVSPSRLERAKQEIRELAEQAIGDRLGLVVFAGEAKLVVPLTADRASFTTLVDLVDPYVVDKGGTDLGAALETSLDALAWREGAAGTILLLTDGEDLSGRGERRARRCRDRGIVVHTVGLGTARGAKIALPVEGGETYLKDRSGRDVVSALDAAGLARIAAIAGGTSTTVVSGSEPGSLAGLYEKEILPLARTALATGERRPEDRFQWPLIVALLLWLVELGMTDRARVRSPRPAFAAATLVLLSALLLGGCDATTEGRRAWDDGDEEAALAHFDTAVAEAGEGAGASAALLYDQAVAALAVGEYERAEAAAREAALRDEDAYAGLDAFVRGSAAFARSEVAFVQASATPDDPRALMPALRFAEDALAGWQWAAASRPDDWPEARRNAERGLLWLQDLRELRAGDGQKKPPPPDETDPEEEEKPPEPLPPLETEDLPSGRVLELLELLQAKEQKKILERRARRHVRGGSVEKDW